MIYIIALSIFMFQFVYLMLCCGHNLSPLYFDPPEKNIMGTPRNLKIKIVISYYLTDSPIGYMASSFGLDLFWKMLNALCLGPL